LIATLPSASRNRRSRITRLCTLSPSLPASGLSLTVDQSWPDGRRIDGLGRQRLDQARDRRCVSATVASGQAGDGDDVARFGKVDRLTLQATEGEDLGDPAALDLLAVAGQCLDGLPGTTLPVRPAR
jgi:hypothetical protein